MKTGTTTRSNFNNQWDILGTPSELKRSIGTDVVIAQLDTDHERAVEALRNLDGVDHVDRFGDEVVVSTKDGSAALSPVALALDRADITVRQLSLRTPTLDDVFLDVTGTRFEGGDQ